MVRLQQAERLGGSPVVLPRCFIVTLNLFVVGVDRKCGDACEEKREVGGFSLLPRSGPKRRIRSEKEFFHEDQKMRPRGTFVCCYEQR